ncbi:MAG: hypothetical protein ACE5KH_03345 [Candidatus Geothermarchaeales archaeon]
MNALGRDMYYVIITQSDGDQVGSGAALQRLNGAKVAIHEEEAGIPTGREPPVKGGWRKQVR